MLPYPLLKYDIHYNSSYKKNLPSMNIIEAESIYRPAILIPCPDRSSNFGKKYKEDAYKKKKYSSQSASSAAPSASEGGTSTAQIRLWGIPYKIIDRTGYDLTFPAAGNGHGDHIFLNASHMQDIHAAANILDGLLLAPADNDAANDDDQGVYADGVNI
jgi:hypothetical protein